MKTTTPLAPVDLAAAIKLDGSHGHIKRNLILALTILALIGGVWYGWSRLEARKHQPPAYVTEPLIRGVVNLSITSTGNLQPTNQVVVGSELSGIIIEVFVDFNAHVTKGQQLARLDTTKLSELTESNRAAVRAAQAKVSQAEATVNESDVLLARQMELRHLSGGKVPAQTIIDTATATAARSRADLLNAQASVGVAEALVRINESDLTKSIIKSPIDGIVLTRSVDPGQTVAASFTAPQLFVIAEKLERMKLEVTIAEADIGRVAKGQPATFTVDAWPDRSYSAAVSVVSYGSTEKDNVVTYEADLDVTNDDLSLRPGMTATAEILVAQSKDVFIVPATALRFSPSSKTTSGTSKKSFVQSLIPMPTRNSSRPAGLDAEDKDTPVDAKIWVLRNNKAESIAVKTGLSDGRHTEVSGEGLKEGLMVITRANTSTP